MTTALETAVADKLEEMTVIHFLNVLKRPNYIERLFEPYRPFSRDTHKFIIDQGEKWTSAYFEAYRRLINMLDKPMLVTLVRDRYSFISNAIFKSERLTYVLDGTLEDKTIIEDDEFVLIIRGIFEIRLLRDLHHHTPDEHSLSRWVETYMQWIDQYGYLFPNAYREMFREQNRSLEEMKWEHHFYQKLHCSFFEKLPPALFEENRHMLTLAQRRSIKKRKLEALLLDMDTCDPETIDRKRLDDFHLAHNQILALTGRTKPTSNNSEVATVK
jgi:hypothetical protein